MELSFEQKEELGLKYVLDLLEPVCPYGVKRLRAEGFYSPADSAALEQELENVDVLRAALDTVPEQVQRLRHALSALKDVSGSLANCRTGVLAEVELFELTAFALRLQAIRPLAECLPGYAKLTGVCFAPVEGALSVLDPTGSGRLSFFVEDARTPALLALRREKRELERQLRQPEADREALLARRLYVAKEEELALQEIYARMSAQLRPYLDALQQNALAAGRLDAGLCKALLARRMHACRPQMGGTELVLEAAVNPQIAEALEARGGCFTPISASMPQGVTVLTGANMGGKSVAIKTVTLNVALALLGCFVFCRSARIPHFARLELINRDFSSAAGGLSSFGGEILRFNAAAERLEAGGLSFIAMDEFARGTNAREGAAIARGVVRYLAGKNAVTLFATHYDGTALYAEKHYQVRGLRRLEDAALPAAPDGKTGLEQIARYMDYGLIQVEKAAQCPQDALRICRILGLRNEIMNKIEEKDLTNFS